jgi:hypothetical protein
LFVAESLPLQPLSLSPPTPSTCPPLLSVERARRKKPKAFDPLGAGPTKKGGKKKKDVGGGGGGGGVGNPPAGMGATGLPSRASAGAGTPSASNTGAPAGMGSMGLPPKKDKGKTAAKAAAAAPTQEVSNDLLT